tara:strand:- start:464 stop:1120 length:657 start_codon:yes stop_codon:yes gene_type:complete
MEEFNEELPLKERMIMMFLFLASIGALVSVVISSEFSIRSNDNKLNITEDPVDKYLREANEYFERTKNNKNENEYSYKEESNLSRWIIEMTPVGMIIMGYDSQKKYFVYYTDKKGITFNILDAVSKKLCCRIMNFDIYTEVKVNEKDISKKKASKGNVASYKNNQTLNKIVCKEMNTFVSSGRIRDFSFIKKPIVQEQSTSSTMSFKDFKNKFNHNNL